MTLISLYDRDPLDNIGDILSFCPDHCIFLGDSSVMEDSDPYTITRFLKARGMDLPVEFCSVPHGDMDTARERMAQILTDHPGCIMDVSGGTEMLIALAGIMAERFHIPLYQRRDRSHKLLWSIHCEPQPKIPALTVEEVVALHRGTILDLKRPPKESDPLHRYIPLLWEVARKAPSDYNHLCTALAYLMANSRSDHPLELRASKQDMERSPGHMDDFLLREMSSVGVISDLYIDSRGVSFRFACSGLREILTKAGNLLEEVTCLAGSTFASDSASGISMDWDGKTANRGASNTKNELDGMLTIELLPVCISCKNGNIDNNALYELDTVSRHFAGSFAKRILVASYVNHNSQSVQHLRQRALDMDIIPLFDAHSYTFEDFTRELKKYCVQ